MATTRLRHSLLSVACGLALAAACGGSEEDSPPVVESGAGSSGQPSAGAGPGGSGSGGAHAGTSGRSQGGAGSTTGGAGATGGGAGGSAGLSGTSGQINQGGSGGVAGQGGAGGVATGGTSAGESSGGQGGGGAAALHACGHRATHPNAWFDQEFAGAPELTGTFTKRTSVELPSFIHDAQAGTAKYAFDLEEQKAPDDPRVGFRNVSIADLKSPDGFGASIQPVGAPGAHLFLSNVTIEPNWPAWKSYDTTNYDGIVLDGSEDIYAEDLTIRNWNADSALDIKSKHAEFVCLTTEGDGHRTLRLWNIGPHYIVKSSVNNGDGVILWFEKCDGAEVRIYDSTFNGEAKVPASKIECHNGSKPKITYLTTDPRTTGEMHPMFSQP